ncbi:MAG: CehA/McbA family metallohydrolase, partial [Balneolales bacterium]
AYAQHDHHHHAGSHHAFPEFVENVEPQPLIAQALRVAEALSYMGSALPQASLNELKALKDLPLNQRTVMKIQEILDPFVLATIDINAESRVKVIPGAAQPILKQEGWTTFLLKVHNQAHVTAVLEVESPNAEPVLHISTNAHRMAEANRLTPGQLDNRFLEIAIDRNPPLSPNLSGLDLEYAVMHIYTRASGRREAQFGFNVGQGTQDIGFRNTADILFDIQPAVKVVFDVKDEDDASPMASFIITDDLPRENRLRGIYPLPARRVASRDPFPDFFFQPQIYRQSGEYVHLPPGTYNVTFGRGPEYHPQQKTLTVPENVDSMEASFRLKRWIHMAGEGWHSYDHHIHAAGCSHYESPEQGVPPEHMWRQIQGEDLNIGSNLTWGPGWYHQRQYFTGEEHALSDEDNILRYDIEISGFPSSHAGHLVLLDLNEDEYPNTSQIEDWPTWTLPVLEWAKSQGGITGYAHSGWGLYPSETTYELPNYVTPRMDGIGANEYVVTVTHDVVDLYSLGDTPAPVELNMWYHTLNSGFRTRISGETDFPCIYDERVGMARTYAHCDLNFSSLMDAVKRGKSYVSDGFSHLIDFTVNGVVLGEANSELSVDGPETLQVSVRAAAMLPETQDEIGALIASRLPDEAPYWHIERSRIASSRRIPVELIVNGYPVETREIEADGNWNELTFSYRIEESAWMAVRVNASSHTNPIFVEVDDKPVRVKKSAEWLRCAVDQCWEMKSPRFRESELEAAREAYDHARRVYDAIIREADG